jgi:hypothetical protein
MTSNHFILLTVDVEDWFQVENFKQCIPFSSWPNCDLRVEANTHRLLDLLDSVKLNTHGPQSLRQRRIEVSRFHQGTEKITKSNKSSLPRRAERSYRGKSCLTTSSPKATFFILGWLAERLPHLVREIHSRGHEVGSHGYYHELCTKESGGDLKRDLVDSKTLLEDIIGAPIFGYRAPSFCINNNILKIIKDSGYLYDSSFNSFGMHGRYGRLALSQNGKRGIAHQISNSFYELAISNIRLGNHILRPLQNVQSCSRSMKAKILTAGILGVFRGSKSESEAEIEQKGMFWKGLTLPWGGGAYFRLIPLPLFRMGVQSILNREKAYVFYMHPWEIDQEQPRVENAPRFFKFRHYANLDKTACKLSSFIEDFESSRFVTCHQYLEEHLEENRSN